MNTIISEDKGTKGMATNTKETQAWVREAGDMCWDRGVGDRTSDRVDGSRVANVSRLGNIRKGWLGGDVREAFCGGSRWVGDRRRVVGRLSRGN